ncbi:HugZ family protein [Magnetospirillum sulfuroxidans]|uniref:Pyridoxamine 5'-phosphate oxidase family protein n=1 Tax=Magnetospirillum sulfuroxidans TaxID=611300 RepID=A0ABS5IC38_9PROT|nr:pyridoxamine 5'-phosphate oxidase family protein [Magnetospirillum sulfuroxidans]MBR9971990.1 pyridoxamine 5'-phosphate oxidase family protein [Magnetospirillum sulfuroxidans]
MDTAPPQQLPKDNKLALRHVARACRKATLATVMAEGGAPYGSLVTVALDHDLSAILLLSGLADHSRNIAADDRVSLLFDGTDGHPNPQTGPRVTLMGRAEKTDCPRLRARFLALHPAAALYADFADFGFWRVNPDRAHFVGGFGRAVWINTPFGLDSAVAETLSAAQSEVLGQRIPTLWGGGDVIGWDVDGVDVTRNESTTRIAFSHPAENLGNARKALENLQIQGQF